jgi:hypothetical protein
MPYIFCVMISSGRTIEKTESYPMLPISGDLPLLVET